jgi:hypothetical protein
MDNHRKLIIAGALLAIGIAPQASAAERYDAAQVRAEELGGKPFTAAEQNEPSSTFGVYDAARVRATELGGKPFIASERDAPSSQFGAADVEREDVARIGGKVEVLSSRGSDGSRSASTTSFETVTPLQPAPFNPRHAS